MSKNRFFTSDLHFGDDRLYLYGRDILFDNSKEVDNFIIKNWNKVVKKDDLVIVVGDVSLTKTGLKNLNKLNGEKWLIKGNYDTSKKDGGTAKFDITDDLLSEYFTKVVDELEINIGKEKVYINHYPTNGKKDMFNIVGHIHGTWKVQRNMINVGVDAWHFTPVSEKQIKFQMNGIKKHYDENVFAGELNANKVLKEEISKIKKYIKLLTEGNGYDYNCAMLFFSFPEINEIHDLIDSNDLFTKPDEDYGLEKEPNVTLLYGLHDNVTVKDVESILDNYTFSTCKAHNPSLFSNDEYDVLKFDIVGDNLSEINKELTKFPHTTDYPDYHPHMTIAYLKPGLGKKYVKKLKGKKYWLPPKYAVYSTTDGKKHKISISID